MSDDRRGIAEWANPGDALGPIIEQEPVLSQRLGKFRYSLTLREEVFIPCPDVEFSLEDLREIALSLEIQERMDRT